MNLVLCGYRTHHASPRFDPGEGAVMIQVNRLTDIEREFAAATRDPERLERGFFGIPVPIRIEMTWFMVPANSPLVFDHVRKKRKTHTFAATV